MTTALITNTAFKSVSTIKSEKPNKDFHINNFNVNKSIEKKLNEKSERKEEKRRKTATT